MFWLQYHIWENIRNFHVFWNFSLNRNSFPTNMALLICNISLQNCYSKCFTTNSYFPFKTWRFSPWMFSRITIYPTSTIRSAIYFSDYDDDIPATFSLLTAEMCRLFKKVDFYILKRAVLQQKHISGGLQFSDDLYHSITSLTLC